MKSGAASPAQVDNLPPQEIVAVEITRRCVRRSAGATAEEENSMDIRHYYEKLREVENGLPEGNVLIVSLDTPDGGRAGVTSELDRKLAAKLIVEHRARPASEDEVAAFRKSRAKR
jgi:hypothetical protein